jgi:hypothetical protein
MLSLPNININHGDWIELRVYLQKLLDNERQKLESAEMDHDTTQFCRGTISALKGLLSLENKIIAKRNQQAL